jgi:hypothetical protein
MTVRERVENNLVVWHLGTLLTGFLAGIATYRGILEIAQLAVVPKSKLENVEPSPPSTTTAKDVPINSVDTPGPSPVPNVPPRSPLPDGYDSVKPGMKLSDAQLAFPGGRLGTASYRVELRSEHFASVTFIAAGHEEDPPIDLIAFHFKNDTGRESAITTLLQKFGSLPHRRESLGKRLVWPNIGGLELTIDDDSYSVSVYNPFR